MIAQNFERWADTNIFTYFNSPEKYIKFTQSCKVFKQLYNLGREINTIATEIGYDRDVVRVWFCNKRQSLRNNNTPQRGRISNKTSPLPTP